MLTYIVCVLKSNIDQVKNQLSNVTGYNLKNMSLITMATNTFKFDKHRKNACWCSNYWNIDLFSAKQSAMTPSVLGWQV